MAVIRKFGTMFKRKIKGEVVMLKGKKKALVAQVLLGLMVAGNVYAVDCGVVWLGYSDESAAASRRC